jgi:hypothetical protein
MFYGYRVIPAWYQSAPRPPRGRREWGVVFKMLMVNTLGRMQNAECRSREQGRPKPHQCDIKATPKLPQSQGSGRGLGCFRVDTMNYPGVAPAVSGSCCDVPRGHLPFRRARAGGAGHRRAADARRRAAERSKAESGLIAAGAAAPGLDRLVRNGTVKLMVSP